MGLLLDRDGTDVLVLRLDRPDRRNAIDPPLLDALLEAFDGVTARIVVLGSTDPGCFCAGADLSIPDADRSALSDRLYELYGVMIGLGVPIIAAVGGHAVGGGAQLALASDLRVVSPGVRFRFVGAGHGLAVGSWALPSLVGRGRALDLCSTARPVLAPEALQIGLADRVADDPLEAAVALAHELVAADGGALGRVKATVGAASGLADALARERRGNATWAGSAPLPPRN